MFLSGPYRFRVGNFENLESDLIGSDPMGSEDGTMKFRIEELNFLLILTKVFVLKLDHQVALESNFKSSNCHNFGF